MGCYLFLHISGSLVETSVNIINATFMYDLYSKGLFACSCSVQMAGRCLKRISLSISNTMCTNFLISRNIEQFFQIIITRIWGVNEISNTGADRNFERSQMYSNLEVKIYGSLCDIARDMLEILRHWFSMPFARIRSPTCPSPKNLKLVPQLIGSPYLKVSDRMQKQCTKSLCRVPWNSTSFQSVLLCSTLIFWRSGGPHRWRLLSEIVLVHQLLSHRA